MKRTLKKATDAEAKEHELHCWVHDILFFQRTMYSCNCDQRELYQKNFDKNREKVGSVKN